MSTVSSQHAVAAATDSDESALADFAIGTDAPLSGTDAPLPRSEAAIVPLLPEKRHPWPRLAPRREAWRPSRNHVIAIGAFLVTAALGAAIYRYLPGSGSATGILGVESVPPGAEVRLDGQLLGRTPLSVTGATGEHGLRVATRELRVNVSPGVETVHHVIVPSQTVDPVTPAQTPEHGSLTVSADDAGAIVELDGVNRGAAPLTIADLERGEHRVVLRSPAGTVLARRTVRIEPGSSTSLVINRGAPAAQPGWLAATAGVALHIYEDGTLIGTTEASRLMLPAGRHDLEFVSEPLGFRTRRTVDLAAGRTTSVAVPLDRAPININAIPWAEVLIDGMPAGQTPMAAVMTTIGPHDIEFRHPELGRKTTRVVVSLKEPARVSVDMRSR
jgi:hypothetical protein